MAHSPRPSLGTVPGELSTEGKRHSEFEWGQDVHTRRDQRPTEKLIRGIQRSHEMRVEPVSLSSRIEILSFSSLLRSHSVPWYSAELCFLKRRIYVLLTNISTP
jgi:hypothetical protein